MSQPDKPLGVEGPASGTTFENTAKTTRPIESPTIREKPSEISPETVSGPFCDPSPSPHPTLTPAARPSTRNLAEGIISGEIALPPVEVCWR